MTYIVCSSFWLTVSLSLSIVINAVFAALAGYWLDRRGGLRYFRRKAVRGNLDKGPVVNRRNFYHACDLKWQAHCSIVMFGDSLTAAGLWAEWYGVGVLNRGIGGETTKDALLRVSDIASLHAAKVFILHGTNDFQKLPADATISNLRQIITEIQDGSPGGGAEIYIQSLLPPPTPEREQWVIQINSGLERLAEEMQVHWIDLYPRFTDASGRFINSDLTLDGIHLNVEGYAVWRQVLETGEIISISSQSRP